LIQNLLQVKRRNMNTKTLKLFVMAFLAVSALSVLFMGGRATPQVSAHSTGAATVESLTENYNAWLAEYEKNGGDRNMTMAVGAFSGISTEFTSAQGKASLNLVDGKVAVEVKGLPQAGGYDVWLVDNTSGPSNGILPEEGDPMIRLGRLTESGGAAKLEAILAQDFFAGFELDLLVVTHAGKSPIEDRVVVGTTTLFHRLHRSQQRGQFGVLKGAESLLRAAPAEEQGFLSRVLNAITPTAEAQMGPNPNPSNPLEQLIAAGRQSFLNDTFQGNGRTCATCHREDNNFTIDQEFIATLPPNDPLFVAEFIPALATGFEQPELMRKFGLILENVDGFNNPGVMRGVPHTLALLQNTLTPVAGGLDGTTTPPNERTGWGGDGAPGTGTLREFLIGAVVQHYPKTLNRIVGQDFVLPTVAQLDAVEAFQKSIGRRADLDLNTLSLKSEMAKKGQEIFLNPGNVLDPNASNEGAGKCFFCHLNAGASDFFFPGQNANFNTNVEGLPFQPADLVVGASVPPDGGFGGSGASPTGGIGNGSFNTPVVVEAADTPPFFHNNAIGTIEGAVDFYNSEAFNQAPGFGSLIGGIRLEAVEVEAVAAFLRVINALENIRSAEDLALRARATSNAPAARELLRLSITELLDAVEVLSCASLHPEAQIKLVQAAGLLQQGIQAASKSGRDSRINQALPLITGARDDMQN
jgi:cytochrome c peroxidase